MKENFIPGAVVRFNQPNGSRARIETYVRDGWYEVVTIPDRRRLIANEADLVFERGPDASANNS